MQAIETFEHAGLTVKIFQDESPESPRDWDNLGTMVCWRRRYTLGDKHNHAVGTPIESIAGKGAVILPLYLYDHSGITMNTTGFQCPWDSGQVGWIFTSRDRILREYGKKILIKALKNGVRDQLVNEVKVYDQYLTGEVYGYRIEDSEGNDLDSCWGFYGLEYVQTQAREMAESIAKSLVGNGAGI